MELREKIKRYLEILRENNTITISTASKDGKLWSTKAYYGEEDGYIYVILENKGRAFNNIKENPNIFFVIEKGEPIRFIQGEGEVEIIGHIEQFEKERTIVVRKNFPIVGFLKAIRDCSVIRIKPKKVFVSDFSKGFIPRFEIEFDEKTFNLLKEVSPKPSKINAYIQATRPWSIGITISAVILGSLLAPNIDVVKFFLTLVGALLVHLGVNAWSDYFDYKKGADRWDTLGSSRVIVDGLLKPSEVLLIGSILIILASIIGIILTMMTGPDLLKILLIGAFLGIFYTFVPLGLKYIALGDLAVFLSWSLISLGSYYIQTLEISPIPFLAFIPIALLVVGILHGNNMRDLADDKKSGYITIAGILGLKGSQFYYLILVFGAYVSILVLVIFKILPIWALVAFLTLPNALRNVDWAFRPNYLQFGMLDFYTAQLSNSVSIFIILGLLMSKLFS
ncbi:MAG: 1,4-dihydroxy-2-naphthoate octaprenyltransferase [candidate division WOR-3 bacterium]|nr:1,4-dihydroxy-2-naphthoate octaprenyltransferase [candidate division WOR-3 bacterium]